MKAIPSLELFNKISNHIKNEGGANYGLFLLGWKSGLRVSEAISFDFHQKHFKHKDLYLVRGKGNKKRYVYISPSVISELKKQNWKPNQTNRLNFYHFLQKTKKELNISKNIELTPHTLRRCFTTYQALKGVPMPILQKVLGHKNVRTTSGYWKGSVDIREISEWLEFPSKQLEPDETPPVKISDDYQLPKIRKIPVQLEKPSLNSSQESENLKAIARLKEQLAQKDLVIMEKDRQLQSKDSEIQRITELLKDAKHLIFASKQSSKESEKQISLLTNENEKLRAVSQEKDRRLVSFAETLNKVELEKNQQLKKLQEKLKKITKENPANLKNTAKNLDKNQIQFQLSRRKTTPKIWLYYEENSFRTVLSKRSDNQFTELLDKSEKENLPKAFSPPGKTGALPLIKKLKTSLLTNKKKLAERELKQTQENLIAEIQVWKKK